jgi:hypothetical protein
MFGAITHGFRLMKAGFVLAREGVFALADPQALPPGPRGLLSGRTPAPVRCGLPLH